MVELRQRSSELAGAWTGSRDDDERFGGFDIGVGTIACIGNNSVNISGVAFGERMEINFDFVIFEFVGKIFGFFLTIKKGDDDRANIEIFGAQEFDEADDFGFVGNHVIGADFGFFDGVSVDAKDDFGDVFEFLEKTDFEIG